MNTETVTRTNTPGYNQHLDIWLSTDRAGRPRAFFFGVRSRRVMPIGRDKAELLIAQGLATKVDTPKGVSR